MNSVNDFQQAFQSAYPEKRVFTGQKKEAIGQEGQLIDRDQDGDTDIADVLLDGSLTDREYQAVLAHYAKSPEDAPIFDQALAKFLTGSAETEVAFLEHLQTLRSGQSESEILLYGVDKAPTYERMDLVTGHLKVQLLDHDGVTVDSREDLEVTVDGHMRVSVDLPPELEIPPIATVQANKGNAVLSVMGFQILAAGLQQQNGIDYLQVIPPSQQLLDLAKTLGLEIPEFSPETLAKMLDIPTDQVEKTAEGAYRIPMMTILKTQFPKGIPVGNRQININKLDLSGMQLKDARLEAGKLTLQLGFDNVAVKGGSGSKKTKETLKETLLLDVAIGDISLGDTTPSQATLSSGQIRLKNVTGELKQIIEDLGEGYLDDVRVQWKGDQLLVSASAAEGTVTAKIPFTVEGRHLAVDFSGLRLLGIPASDASDRLNQYLSNTTQFQSKSKGNQLILDLDEIFVKTMPQAAQMHRIESANFHEGVISLTFTKNSHDPVVFAPPDPQPPEVNRNIITPQIGIDTQGHGIFGLNYTHAIPFGRSPIGHLLGVDENLGTLPNLSHSYLDNTYSISGNVSTDGVIRFDASTGLRGSLTPAGIPVYLQFDPLGVGMRVDPGNSVNAYLPMKVGLGYDNGTWTAGLNYQHNFVFGNQDENILSATAGVRF